MAEEHAGLRRLIAADDGLGPLRAPEVERTALPRVDSLTGLRMLAAGVVYLSHLQPPASVPHWVRVFFASGYNGVTLFFVLSGFVLTWNYGEGLGEHPSVSGLRSFFVARLARIYPVYLFALAWVIAPWWRRGASLPHVWWHIFAIQAWSGNLTNAFRYNGPGWSVGVEFFLYACFPLLAVAFQFVRRDWRALIGIAIAAIGFAGVMLAWASITGRTGLPFASSNSAHRWLYRTPWTRLGDFVLGIAAAYLVMLIPSGMARLWGRVAQYVGGTAIIAMMVSSAVYLSAASFDVLYMAPIFLLIFGLALTQSTWLARALSTKTMLLLGESSFAFYLFHAALVDMLPVSGQLPADRWLLSTALNFAVIVSVAVGVHLLVEVPSRRFVRRVLDPQTH